MRKLLVLLILAACSNEPDTTASVSDGGISFIHLNDTYRVGTVEDGNAGGFGRVVTIIQALQAEGREVRILHGGDFLYPSPGKPGLGRCPDDRGFQLYGRHSRHVCRSGNHEFDSRQTDPLVNAVLASEFDWVGDNFVFNTGNADVDSALRRDFVVEVSGKRIGIFGLTLHEADGGNARDYVPTERDTMSAARRSLANLEALGVDAIVGLTHLHMWQDEEIATFKAEYPKLAFIAGGHEHEPEYAPESDGAAAVMKGASNARKIWRIDLDFADDGTPHSQR